MTPERIGPYALLERLGAGAVGDVFLAHQEVPLRRTVALKLLRAGVDARDVLRRFERERAALAVLAHEHIAKVFDAGLAEDGRPYFALEHVAGEPLDAWCQQRDLDVGARLALFLQVCDAVQHAHQKGLVHRDLKPSNVLVSDASGTPSCKIVDFGVARALSGELAGETLVTLPGQWLGTPAYMSPEQAGRGHDVDTRADVYSLGVLLYELLTGRRPLDEELARATGPAEIERVLLEVVPRRPSVHRPRLAADLDWITLKALEKERARRYGSPAELADDLARFLEGEPIAARPPSVRYRLAKLAAKHRAASVAVTAVLVALLVGLVTTTVLSAAAREAEQRELAIGNDLARLADLNLVREAEREAAQLWPAHPERLPELEAWLERFARPLEERRPAHQRRLAELSVPSASARDTWERATLSELLAGLERLLDNDPERGVAGSIHARIEAARRLEEATRRPAHAAAWREATAAIRAAPVYGGLELPSQVGLLPLGPDPRTGYHEFWHLPSGAAPEPEPDPAAPSRWRITGESGLVLVLLPGGPFIVGAQKDDPGAPRFDPISAFPFEPTQLDPFFVSKYEMTQGQWRRVTGASPSRYTEDGEAHPVERVSWYDAREALRRIGFVLPTEAQWEYAARAGTDTPWWCGMREEDLAGSANIADLAMHAAGLLRGYACTTSVDDCWVTHAPVGSFRANAFGLHDTAGNVYEWCLDTNQNYGVPLRPGDGRAISMRTDAEQRIDRGGSFYRPAMQARSAEEDYFPAATRVDYLGLRPARALDRR